MATGAGNQILIDKLSANCRELEADLANEAQRSMSAENKAERLRLERDGLVLEIRELLQCVYTFLTWHEEGLPPEPERREWYFRSKRAFLKSSRQAGGAEE